SDKRQKDDIENLKQSDAVRSVPFEKRIQKQKEILQLPTLPTTTIGSLPQTPEVRRTRSQWRKEEITATQYEQFVNEQIKKWITIQEDVDHDVLDHGEIERKYKIT